MATRLPPPRRFRRRWLLTVVILLVVGAVWSVQLWRLLSSVDEHAAWWARPRGVPGGLVYVAVGDSAAQGIGASTPDNGYVGLLADRLRERTGQPVLVVNLSRSGATMRDVVEEQLPRLDGLRADVITVDVGGNDIRDYDPARYQHDVTALVDGLPAGTVIADIPYFMHGRAQDNASQAAATIRALAERRGLVVAPLQDTMRARGWIGMFTDYAADWFHPNDRGHQVWAQAFWTVLESRVPRQGSSWPRCPARVVTGCSSTSPTAASSAPPSSPSRPVRPLPTAAHPRGRALMTAVADRKHMNQVDLAITGMTCASCANHIEHKLNKLDGVTATVNYTTEKAHVSYPDGLDPQELVGQVEAAGYTATLPTPPVEGAAEKAAEPDPTRALRIRLLVSLALSVPVVAMAMVPALQFTYWQWLSLTLAATARRPWTR